MNHKWYLKVLHENVLFLLHLQYLEQIRILSNFRNNVQKQCLYVRCLNYLISKLDEYFLLNYIVQNNINDRVYSIFNIFLIM